MLCSRLFGECRLVTTFRRLGATTDTTVHEASSGRVIPRFGDADNRI